MDEPHCLCADAARTGAGTRQCRRPDLSGSRHQDHRAGRSGGRLLADQLSRRLGQSVFVENRAGGGMSIGTQGVATAPPDGYTLLVGGLANIVFNAGLYKKLPYDPLNDLVPVALVFNISYTLVGAKDRPYN